MEGKKPQYIFGLPYPVELIDKDKPSYLDMTDEELKEYKRKKRHGALLKKWLLEDFAEVEDENS